LCVAGKVEERDSFAEIGFVGIPVPIDLALAARLLLAGMASTPSTATPVAPAPKRD
jgi:hypothetical protein